MRFECHAQEDVRGVPESREQEGVLVNRCLQGDSAAWETIVQSYGHRIARLVGRYTRLRGETEDLTQEVFLRVYLNLCTFRADSGKLSHWVTRVGRNLVIDYLRRNRHALKHQGSDCLESLNLRNDAPTPEASVARQEVSWLLHRGLDVLSPELQEVLVMRYLEELSYREISRRLGLPDGTVKSRISRGRARLADFCGRELQSRRTEKGENDGSIPLDKNPCTIAQRNRAVPEAKNLRAPYPPYRALE